MNLVRLNKLLCLATLSGWFVWVRYCSEKIHIQTTVTQNTVNDNNEQDV